MKALATSVLALAAIAGSAHAQCTLLRYGVPDFDQKRNALPGDGGMYCVPTSFTNIRGYIANHGYGNIMGGGGNWQSNSNYNYVTARIDAMGEYMDTDPVDGTNGGDAIDGWRDFIDDWHDDKFCLNAWGGYVPPFWIYTGFLTGITNMCYGYYKNQGGGVYDRDGGHCMTVVGLKGLCSNFNEPILRFKNPASDDGNINAQGTFSSEETHTDYQTFNYDGDVVGRLRLTDFGVGSSTRRYMDKFYSVVPQIALTGGVSRAGDLQIHRPVALFGITPPSSSSQSPSPGMEISEIALHPMGFEAYILKIDPANNNKRLYRHNLITDEWTTALPTFVSANAHIAMSRFGHLFVAVDGGITKYDTSLGAFPILDTTPSLAPIVDMEYDDLTDELVALISTRRLLRYSDDLTPVANEPIPSAVAIVGDGSVFPDPTAPKRWYIGSSGSPSIYRLVPDSPTVSRMHVDSTITFPVGTEPRSLVMTDSGHLVFIDRGVIADWKFVDFSTHAAWVPDDTSAIGDLPAGRTLVVNRSRNNFVAGIHDQPKWQDDVYEEEGVPSIPDCAPDLNMDGVADILDFLLFIDSFSSCEGEPGPCGLEGVNADYLNDGEVDILDFLEFIDDFSNGC